MLHFLNGVANDIESTRRSKRTSDSLNEEIAHKNDERKVSKKTILFYEKDSRLNLMCKNILTILRSKLCLSRP